MRFDRWFCFHAGRPSSLSVRDVVIECPKDPFIQLLARLCKSISRSANEIYGQSHQSLLHMWRVARSINDELHAHDAQAQQTLGFGLDVRSQTGSRGVRQTVFTTCVFSRLQNMVSILTTYSILSHTSAYLSPFLDIPWSLES